MAQTLPLVQLQLLKPLVRALRLRGVDPAEVLGTVGLTVEALGRKNATVHVMVVHQFVENCAAATHDRTFCARVGAGFDIDGWPMLRKAGTDGKSLGEFLNIYVAQATKSASSVTAYLEIRGETCAFGEARRFKPTLVPAQNDGFMVGLKVAILRRTLGARLVPKQVTLTLCEPSVLPDDFRSFKIVRGDAMGARLQFPTSWLNLPLARTADLPGADDVEGGIATLGFLDGLRDLIRQNIAGGGLSARDVAALVHMQPRTLSRRLSGFGTSISAEIAEAKMAYAKRMLSESSATIDRIARDLGYVDASNFSRGFIKREGKTPTQYRKSARYIVANQNRP